VTDRRTDRQTLLRRCGWVAQLSMRVCRLVTDRQMDGQTDRQTDKQTLLRRCGWVAQLSIRVCAMTDRHASTAGKLCTSNRQPGRVTTPTQNRSGKLHTHTHTPATHSVLPAASHTHAHTDAQAQHYRPQRQTVSTTSTQHSRVWNEAIIDRRLRPVLPPGELL